jgi:DNA polymerase III epsilon subunit-like protein
MAYAKLYHSEKLTKFNLASLAEYFGLKNERAHTALADTRVTYEVYKKLLEV